MPRIHQVPSTYSNFKVKSRLQWCHEILELLDFNKENNRLEFESTFTQIFWKMMMNNLVLKQVLDIMMEKNLVVMNESSDHSIRHYNGVYRKWYSITNKGERLLKYIKELYTLCPECRVIN